MLRILIVLAGLIPGVALAGGPVTVIDGDSLRAAGRDVQLWGIDAPELGQTCLNNGRRWRCGLEAALVLRKLVAFGPVDCVPSAKPARGDRCTVGDRDLAKAMLKQGYAVTLPGAPDDYLKAEAAAKAASLGVWRGKFVVPVAWRQGMRLAAEAAEPAEVCDVKGVVGGDDRRVFYVPTDAAYAAVSVDSARGERLFCSDDEARLAGWSYAAE